MEQSSTNALIVGAILFAVPIGIAAIITYMNFQGDFDGGDILFSIVIGSLFGLLVLAMMTIAVMKSSSTGVKVKSYAVRSAQIKKSTPNRVDMVMENGKTKSASNVEIEHLSKRKNVKKTKIKLTYQEVISEKWVWKVNRGTVKDNNLTPTKRLYITTIKPAQKTNLKSTE